MERIKVSVLVPIYNASEYLGKCLDSIVNQTYENIEIILIDDGSTDSSLEICQRYASNDDRIRVIHQENAGISAVRNRCLSEAVGDYVFFIDSDDWIDPDTISVLADIAINEDADIVASHYVMRAKDTAEADNASYKCTEYTARDFVYLMTKPAGFFCFPWGRLMRRSLFPDNPFPVGKIFEDLMTMPGIVWKANKVIFVSAKLYYYRYTKTGLSHGKFSYRALQEIDGYKDLVDLASAYRDWPIARNGILFYLTKYYYYYWRVIYHRMDIEAYRKDYRKNAHVYFKYLMTAGRKFKK